MSKKYKLIIAYDGKAYFGWQVQPNGNCIQPIVQQTLSKILREEIDLTGASRTDAGVHALGQVAHFITNQSFEISKLLHSMNGLLPKDIRILEVIPVDNDFHARYSAIRKTYHYYLQLGLGKDPFNHNYRYQFFKKIDFDLMQKACPFFIGRHDFTSFANEAHTGCAKNKPIKYMFHVGCIRENDTIRLEFQADGFLYKMVRTIVGTLIEVAAGKIALENIPKIFEAKDRRLAGPAVPAHGLFLIKIDY